MEMAFVIASMVDYYKTLLWIAVISTGVFAYIIRLLYEGYDSRAHIRALKCRGIVNSIGS